MQILHFIFLLLEDVRWEGDFGDSDSWSSVLPCGNWTEMSRGCMEVSWNLFPKAELSHHSRPWGFLPLVGLYQSGELAACSGWLGSWLLFPVEEKKSLTYLWCIALVLWNTALVSPHWNHMVHKGNTDPLLFLYKKLHHRSNDSYLCACEGRAAQGRQDEDLTEGFWQMGDFVLISYQTVSQAHSSIRSAVFVWSRPECCLVHAAAQSYRICRQNPFFPTITQCKRLSSPHC